MPTLNVTLIFLLLSFDERENLLASQGVHPVTAEAETFLPPADQLSPTAMLSSEPSGAGAASYFKSYYAKNRDKILAKVKAYSLSNLDKISEAKRRFYLNNRDKCLEKSRIQRLRNPEKMKAYKIAWIKNNPGKKEALDKEWKLANKDRMAASRRKWAIANKERKKQLNKNWENDHQDQYRAIMKESAHRRRDKLSKCSVAERKTISKWIETWLGKKLVRCYWCRIMEKPQNCHIDHITPISKGGLHALSNLCISCASCNQKKNAKLISTWNNQIEEPVLL